MLLVLFMYFFYFPFIFSLPWRSRTLLRCLQYLSTVMTFRRYTFGSKKTIRRRRRSRRKNEAKRFNDHVIRRRKCFGASLWPGSVRCRLSCPGVISCRRLALWTPRNSCCSRQWSTRWGHVLLMALGARFCLSVDVLISDVISQGMIIFYLSFVSWH